MDSARLESLVNGAETLLGRPLTGREAVSLAQAAEDAGRSRDADTIAGFAAAPAARRSGRATVTLSCDPGETGDAYVFGLVADGIKGLTAEARESLKSGGELSIEFGSAPAALNVFNELLYIQRASDGIMRTLTVRDAAGRDLAPPVRKEEIIAAAARVRDQNRLQAVTKYASETVRRIAKLTGVKKAETGRAREPA